ncbi:hypothetical protein QFC19_004112 [Naganishia cerealis]|uniref:Uncharacterized protein n=1 Tax=Naganishia cerealis TaxID=610337 RepID=A0ACC2VY64_9TREE|nr:hypothetical protein QFC19_004112 [Naganishia cerealis]
MSPEPTHRILFKPLDNSETGGCHIDVYLPTNPKGAPIAWMIHGGGYTIGGSHHIPVDQVEWFLEHGVVVVSSEYRLLPQYARLSLVLWAYRSSPDSCESAHDSASLADIRQDNLDAYKWILNDLNTATQQELNSSKIAILGWSAGGSSLLYLAHDANKAELQSPTCLIPTYPKIQMNDGKSRPQSALREACTEEEWAAIQLIYKEPVSTGYKHGITWYKDDKSRRAKWMMAAMHSGCLHSILMRHDPPYPSENNPIDLLDSTYPPTFVVIATADWLIPPSESHAVVEKLRAAGVEAAFAEAPGMGHGICEDPRSTWPPEGEKWWQEAILPSLQWAENKLKV